MDLLDLSHEIKTQWKSVVYNYLKTCDLTEINSVLKENTFLPEAKSIFKAFNYFNPIDTKVVILGQDPYPDPKNAMGLSFSVPSDVPLPRSLRNIFIEAGIDKKNGNLEEWANKGVLLLNYALTTLKFKSNSHHDIWSKIELCDYIISYLSSEYKNIVFMLWGNNARKLKSLIDDKKHLVLEAVHPSPLSANRGFFGCGHFKKANQYLKEHNKESIF